LLGQLETSYETRKGFWKGGTVGVIGYGGGIIPRFTELKDADGKPLFPEAAEFHTLRVQPPAGMHYTSDLLRKLCDVWVNNGGSGLIAFHGQSGDIMFQGVSTRMCRKRSTASTKSVSTSAAPDRHCAPRCPASARHAAKCPASTRRAPCAP
jgi:dissimilatory sulfite reductase alpha subunit